MKTLRFGLAAALLPAACTAPGDPGPASARGERECFHAGNVSSFRPLEGDAVAVRVGANDHYRLEPVGTCPDIDWAWDIAIRTRGSSWICRGDDAELIVPHPSGTQYCPIRSVRKLSEAEVEALRRR